jgi:hypothetical protein
MNVITPQKRPDTVEPVERMSNQSEGTAPATTPASTNRPLFPADIADEFRSRWDRIQTGFVDEPRDAVHQADELVAEVIKRLSDSFAQERSRLEQQWDRGEQVNTEDLRITLQTYRSFFQRLLAI